MQTLFLQLLRHGMPSGLRKSPQAYLYRAAVNAALNVVRSRRRIDAVADRARLEIPAIVSVDDSDSERRRQLTEAIATLKPRAVEMLILRYTHDLREADIARLLGMSRSAV